MSGQKSRDSRASAMVLLLGLCLLLMATNSARAGEDGVPELQSFRDVRKLLCESGDKQAVLCTERHILLLDRRTPDILAERLKREMRGDCFKEKSGPSGMVNLRNKFLFIVEYHKFKEIQQGNDKIFVADLSFGPIKIPNFILNGFKRGGSAIFEDIPGGGSLWDCQPQSNKITGENIIFAHMSVNDVSRKLCDSIGIVFDHCVYQH
jgi:hypothetical protein